MKKPFKVYAPSLEGGKPRFIKEIIVEMYSLCGDYVLSEESENEIDRIQKHANGIMTGSDIRTLRNLLNLSRQELASLLGCAEVIINRWESGCSHPVGNTNRLLRLLAQEIIKPEDLDSVSGEIIDKPSTKTTTFDIIVNGIFRETIEVEVFNTGGEEFLTPDSSELIERTRAKYLPRSYSECVAPYERKIGDGKWLIPEGARYWSINEWVDSIWVGEPSAPYGEYLIPTDSHTLTTNPNVY